MTTAGATQNHTLTRKSSVTTGTLDWVTSFGTDSINSEWIVSAQNDFSNLGYFTSNGSSVMPCIGTMSFTLTEPAPSNLLEISAVTYDVNCFGGSDGFIDLTVAGGLTPYIIVWSNFQNSEDISG